MKFSESLKKNKDFQFVYRNGKSAGSKLLVMYVCKNESGRDRLGISVSKKVRNSVVRHHLARLVRGSYRLNEEKFDRGLDMIVIARPSAKESSFFDIESALMSLSKRHHILITEDEKNTDKDDTAVPQVHLPG